MPLSMPTISGGACVKPARMKLSHAGGSAFTGILQRLHTRLTGWAMRSPIPAYALAIGGIVLAALIWSQQERSLIPSFKETDVFVEMQGPAGTSLQAMDH